MGTINFARGSLADSLSETSGYKAGLALSLEELCDQLSGTDYPDLILQSEENGARLRADEYEAIFFKLLFRIGYIKEEYDGDCLGAKRIHKYESSGQMREYKRVIFIFQSIWMEQMNNTENNYSLSNDPTPFLSRCREELGIVGVNMAMEHLEFMNRAVILSPHSNFRATEWNNILELQKLFKGTNETPHGGKFIDQRFINYLSNNLEKLPNMHWRKFEELSAEFFYREGYEVELGPGRNDDGVDVRVWKSGAQLTDNPLCLVQCKRHKAKIDKVVIKGLHADVLHERAEYGVIVTTSELSPGARTTIKARGYPIREVERKAVADWLTQLRTPGTGIVRL